jgi:flagellar protein FliS
LQSSLDFEKGKNIAENLFQLYEFVKAQVIAKAKKNHDSDLDSAVMIVSEITQCWKAIK